MDAADTLNDFVGDFITGAMVLNEYSIHHQRNSLPLHLMVPIQKMCLSHLVLTLSKFVEFWERYHDLVPAEHHANCKALIKAIAHKKIVHFRNKAIGHIWDKEQRRPLVHSEIMAQLGFLMDNNLPAFLTWINNPNGNAYPATVVSVVETVRDALMSTHGIDPNEIISR